MRRYSRSEEERIQLQGLVSEWARSGLLNATQGEQLAAECHVERRRTNAFLRAGLALFTTIIIAASVALLLTFLQITGEERVAAVACVAGLVCLGLSEFLVGAFRCYRFGVEEALAVNAVVLLCISGYCDLLQHAGVRGCRRSSRCRLGPAAVRCAGSGLSTRLSAALPGRDSIPARAVCGAATRGRGRGDGGDVRGRPVEAVAVPGGLSRQRIWTVSGGRLGRPLPAAERADYRPVA